MERRANPHHRTDPRSRGGPVALATASGRVYTSAPRDETPVEMGEGLFHLGTVALRSKLLVGAFERGRAKGRPAEEEAALIVHKTV